MSLFRISLTWLGCLLIMQTASPKLVWAKQNYGYPDTGVSGFGPREASGFGVSSPSFPDTQMPGPIDHSSMSPDSWSAPPTGPVPRAATAPDPVPFPSGKRDRNRSQTSGEMSFQTPLTGLGQVGNPSNDFPGRPDGTKTNNWNPVNNFFQPKRPQLLEFDSRNALSNVPSDNAKSEPPSVPDLQPTQASRRTGTGAYPLTRNATQPGVQVPPQQRFASLGSGAPGQIPIDQIEPLQSVQAIPGPVPGSNFVPGFNAQPQITNGPVVVGQFSPPVAVHQQSAGWGYPDAQPVFGNPVQGAFPKAQPAFSPESFPPPQFPNAQPAQGGFPTSQPGFSHGAFPGAQHFGGPSATPPNPHPRSDLGFRSATPTVRHTGSYDNGEKFDFEDKKKQYPPFSEILATGRYFGSIAGQFVRPHAQNNTAFTTTSATFVEGITFDHDFELAPFVRFGFESKFGPGIEFDYFQFDGRSNSAQFTSNGAVSAQIQTLGAGGSQFGTSNAGETLDAQHTIDLETFGISFFKEVDLPISRINGRFGFEYVSIAQDLDASLSNVGGQIGVFNSRSDFRGFGPKFTLEYYRPIGHTPLEFVTTISGGAVYGRRDEFVDNSLGQGFSRVGADELLTTVAFNGGLQFRKNIAENRSIFARVGVTYSTWLGGGTAIDPQSDFGLRGFSFTVGYNR